MTDARQAPLLEVRDVRKHYRAPHTTLASRVTGRKRLVKAVDGVSFQIMAGESFGLVGESGCGKSTIARLVLGLEQPTSGTILFKGRDINRLSRSETREFRRSVAAVFQDPWGSLNPWLKIGKIVSEPIAINEDASRRERHKRAEALLEDVGLRPQLVDRYPHELSGGQRQRVIIARALALHPDLIVLDEPVSALDVSIRAQVMNLLKDLQERYGFSYLLIAHHLMTVKFFCRTLGVAYLGRLVEVGQADEIITRPGHPYMEALVKSSLSATPGEELPSLAGVDGEPPSPIDPPAGCHFRARCPHAMSRCAAEYPPFYGDGPFVRCFLRDPDRPGEVQRVGGNGDDPAAVEDTEMNNQPGVA